MTPFGAVMARPEVAIHVRHIDVRHVPMLKSRVRVDA